MPANTLVLVYINICFLSNENDIRGIMFTYDITESIFILKNAKILCEVICQIMQLFKKMYFVNKCI